MKEKQVKIKEKEEVFMNDKTKKEIEYIMKCLYFRYDYIIQGNEEEKEFLQETKPLKGLDAHTKLKELLKSTKKISNIKVFELRTKYRKMPTSQPIYRG